MAGASKQQKIPKHKVAQQSNRKVKPKGSRSKPPKMRQRPLTFGANVSRPADFASVQPPRGGGRMEEQHSSSSSLLGVVVTSPRNFNREKYNNSSPVPFQQLGAYLFTLPLTSRPTPGKSKRAPVHRFKYYYKLTSRGARPFAHVIAARFQRDAQRQKA